MWNIPYHNCIYNRLPEDEPSGSKHVEDIKKLENNPLKTKRRPLYLKTQSVPRSKHFSSGL